MQFSKKTFLGILAISLMTAAVASAQTISIVSGDGQVAAHVGDHEQGPDGEVGVRLRREEDLGG